MKKDLLEKINSSKYNDSKNSYEKIKFNSPQNIWFNSTTVSVSIEANSLDTTSLVKNNASLSDENEHLSREYLKSDDLINEIISSNNKISLGIDLEESHKDIFEAEEIVKLQETQNNIGNNNFINLSKLLSEKEFSINNEPVFKNDTQTKNIKSKVISYDDIALKTMLSDINVLERSEASSGSLHEYIGIDINSKDFDPKIDDLRKEILNSAKNSNSKLNLNLGNKTETTTQIYNNLIKKQILRMQKKDDISTKEILEIDNWAEQPKLLKKIKKNSSKALKKMVNKNK